MPGAEGVEKQFFPACVARKGRGQREQQGKEDRPGGERDRRLAAAHDMPTGIDHERVRCQKARDLLRQQGTFHPRRDQPGGGLPQHGRGLFHLDRQISQTHPTQTRPPRLIGLPHDPGDRTRPGVAHIRRPARVILPDIGADEGRLPPFHGLDDIEKRNLRRRPRQTITPGRPQRGQHQPGLRQSLQSLGQILFRHTVELGQNLGREITPLRQPGQYRTAMQRPLDLVP